jgi:hypothetical protein
MRWLLPFLVTLTITTGCEHSRAVNPTDGAVGAHGDASPEACDCSDATSVLGGTLLGQTLRFDHTYYGITTTWGTHAEPLSPPEAVALTLLLADHPVGCTADSDWPYDHGLHFPSLRIQAGTLQSVRDGWLQVDEEWIDVEAQLCLLSVPLHEGDPVDDKSTVSGSIPGCATLRFTVGGEPVGLASGHFAALRCLSMDSAFGE